MAYLSQGALESMGFASLGRHVKISEKASLYGVGKMQLGDNCRIDDFCVVSGKITLGRNVHIAPFCLVAGGLAGISLEDFSGLAYRVSVFAQSDDYSGMTMTNPTVPRQFKSEIFAPVHVGRHVIIGTGAIITPGTELAEGTAVGAGSLVLSSTEAWSVYAGSPARKLKARARDLLTMEQSYLSSEG